MCRVCRVCRVFLVTDTAQVELKSGRVQAPASRVVSVKLDKFLFDVVHADAREVDVLERGDDLLDFQRAGHVRVVFAERGPYSVRELQPRRPGFAGALWMLRLEVELQPKPLLDLVNIHERARRLSRVAAEAYECRKDRVLGSWIEPTTQQRCNNARCSALTAAASADDPIQLRHAICRELCSFVCILNHQTSVSRGVNPAVSSRPKAPEIASPTTLPNTLAAQFAMVRRHSSCGVHVQTNTRTSTARALRQLARRC